MNHLTHAYTNMNMKMRDLPKLFWLEPKQKNKTAVHVTHVIFNKRQKYPKTFLNMGWVSWVYYLKKSKN